MHHLQRTLLVMLYMVSDGHPVEMRKSFCDVVASSGAS